MLLEWDGWMGWKTSFGPFPALWKGLSEGMGRAVGWGTASSPASAHQCNEFSILSPLGLSLSQGEEWALTSQRSQPPAGCLGCA